jgi:hypothetical protein
MQYCIPVPSYTTLENYHHVFTRTPISARCSSLQQCESQDTEEGPGREVNNHRGIQ